MVAAALYLAVFICLLWWNRCFGLFRDGHLSRRTLTFLIFAKALAIPAFYFVYEKHYGGLNKFDSGKFYNDAVILNDCAKKHPGQYLQVLSGDEKHACLDQTLNWKQGRSKKFFFNDNHLVIGWHSLLHFLPFASWPTHAFFDCLLSFIGLFFLYRTFVSFFPGRETLMFFVICLLPSIWFYTGGVLKEGMVVFVLGTLCLSIKKFWEEKRLATLILFVCLIVLGSFLKPYLLLTVAFTMALFFGLKNRHNPQHQVTIFAIIFLMGMALANFLSVAILKKDFAQLLTAQEKAFSGAAAGGIFLSGDTTFVQLPYDTTLFLRVTGEKERFRIKRGAAYYYWEDSHNQDTLFNPSNQDTTSLYELAFMTPASGSNYKMPPLTQKPLSAIATAFYHVMFFPFFINAGSVAEILASFENLIIVSCLILLSRGFLRRRRPGLMPVALLCLSLTIFLIVGLSSPNAGAIFRYRAPALLFLVLAGLYYLPFIRKRASAVRE